MHKQCTTDSTIQRQRKLEMCFPELLKTSDCDAITVSLHCCIHEEPLLSGPVVRVTEPLSKTF